MEATRCQPSASASTVTAIISARFGLTVNQTVRPTKPASAPTLRRFFPGRVSGRDLMRADSFRNAITEPVKVTAPMKMPMNTSAWWIRSSEPASSVEPGCCASTSR